jgi:hypothetical protein
MRFMKVPERYIRMRNSVPFDAVSFGYLAVHLLKPGEIEGGQDGYPDWAAAESGQDWKEEYLVIGHEDLAGDPLFIDTSDALFPVYTAVHGEGEWEPDMIACSFRDFAYFLTLIRQASAGRDNPTALESNPLSEEERARILGEIADTGISSTFWKDWLDADGGESES